MNPDKLEIQVFAELKDVIGKNRLEIHLNQEKNILQLFKFISSEMPIFSEIIEQFNKKYKIYLNGYLIDNFDIEISNQDKIVIIPPVGGG